MAYIDTHRDRFGVEPICRVLTEHGCKIAPNTYWVAKNRPPSARALRDEELKPQILRVHSENLDVYGAEDNSYVTPAEFEASYYRQRTPVFAAVTQTGK